MQEKGYIIKDAAPYKAVDGSYHATMKDVETINDAYWQYKNPMIIDKDWDFLTATLPQTAYDKIVASPDYRCLIDILEERIKEQQLSQSESTGTKNRR